MFGMYGKYVFLHIISNINTKKEVPMINVKYAIVEDMVWSTRGLPCARLPWFSALRILLVAAVPMERGASS
jgi:hypothetical protein